MKDFKQFTYIMEVLMNMDSLDRETQSIQMHDWYVLYKELDIESVLTWATQQFDPNDVNKDTHDFWLDPKGAFLVGMEERITELEKRPSMQSFGSTN